MTSDKDDHDDLDFDHDITIEGETDDVLDVSSIDEPLSASPLRSSYDDFGDDAAGHDDGHDEPEDTYGEEDSPAPKKKSGGMTKIVGPLLVLLLAGGAGAYIVTNPSILNQLTAPKAQTNPAVPAATAALDLPGEVAPAAPDVAVIETPPQPLANLNEIAQSEEPAMPDMPLMPDGMDVVQDPMPVVEEDMAAMADVAPEVSLDVQEDTIDVQEGTVEAVLGADVAVSPEAVALENDAPLVVPEENPMPVAPDLEQTVSGPELSDVVEPLEVEQVTDTPELSDVAEPTFVPAPSDIPDVTDDLSVVEAATPPVMNAQELTPVPTPDIAPRTLSQIDPVEGGPQAVGGVASAPAAIQPDPAPASNIYYDSISQVPTGAMATSVGPRELNPVLEPASKMIVVNKTQIEGSQESLLVSANRALKLKRYDSALEIFDQLYAKNNRDSRILMGRAVAQQNMGLSESAIQSYEEVLALKPNHTEALVNMMGLVRSQYPEVALRRLLELYAKHPGNAGIAAQIGITNAELGYFDDALRYLGIASTIEPGNAEHVFNMAIAADRMGNRVEAVKLYERALEIDVVNGGGNTVPREKIYDRLSVLRRG